jgi:hypothetical protein
MRGGAAKDGRQVNDSQHYLAELLRLQAEGKLPAAPGFHHVSVAHDHWCSIYCGGSCDCEPEITLPKVTK